MDFATGLVFVLVHIYYICILACFCARGDRSRRRGGHLLSPLSGLWPSDDDHTNGIATIQICFLYSWSMYAQQVQYRISKFNRYGVVQPSLCPILCPYFQNCKIMKYRSPKESKERFKDKSQPPPRFSKKLQWGNHVLLDDIFRSHTSASIFRSVKKCYQAV